MPECRNVSCTYFLVNRSNVALDVVDQLAYQLKCTNIAVANCITAKHASWLFFSVEIFPS